MRYVSQLFQPLITIPKGAKIKNTEITCKSQKLLVECGLVRPTGSGLFALLPLARRALDKLEALVTSCLEEARAQRVSLPALTPARLWRASGRLDDVGAELLKVEDRYGKQYLLAPTHEEAISELLADVGPISHKQLPLILYQITNKYRDEFRPKHGLLRAREFLMMDAYSVHTDEHCAHTTYQRLTDAYAKLFDKLDLPVYRVVAPAGDMGGSLSHEWQLVARAGEDRLALCRACARAALAPSAHATAPAPAPAPAPAACTHCGAPTDTLNSIEVGHTFVLGERYSAPLGAQCAPPAGGPAPLHMACYGIGITRLLAAALEALSTDTALRWPRALAPYSVLLIGPKEGSREWVGGGRAAAAALGARLAARGPLVDDRHALTVGKRLLHADRMGYPHIVVCGRSALESPPRYELHSVGEGGARGAPLLLTEDELLRAVADTHDDHENKAVAYYTLFHFKLLCDSLVLMWRHS